jgi:hypothetical protein
MAFLAIRVVPVPVEDREWTRPLRPERDRFLELRGQVATQRRIVARLLWLDSVGRMMEPARADGPVLAVGVAPGFPPEAVAGFETRVRNEAAARAPDARGADVGVFVVLDPEGPSSLEEYYMGERRGRPYCLVLRTVRRPDAVHLAGESDAWLADARTPLKDSETSAPRTLGPCSFPARYGAPGTGLEAWLRQGAFGRGARERVPSEYLLRERRTAALGRLPYSAHEVSAVGYRCLEGSREACREVFVTGGTRTVPVVTRAGSVLTELWAAQPGTSSGADFGLADPALFADLEREFGPERFRRFWTSELDPVQSFQAAFGVHPADWVGRWARSYYGEGRAALAAGPAHGIATLLFVVAALALAVGITRRRQVR